MSNDQKVTLWRDKVQTHLSWANVSFMDREYLWNLHDADIKQVQNSDARTKSSAEELRRYGNGLLKTTPKDELGNFFRKMVSEDAELGSFFAK